MRGSDLRTGELFSYVDLEQSSPPSGCCEHFCCRRSTASVRSAS